MGIDDERCRTWNSELLRQAKRFSANSSKASIFVVSSYAIILDILDDPESYGLFDCIEDDVSNSEKEDGDDESDDSDDDSRKAM